MHSSISLNTDLKTILKDVDHFKYTVKGGAGVSDIEVHLRKILYGYFVRGKSDRVFEKRMPIIDKIFWGGGSPEESPFGKYYTAKGKKVTKLLHTKLIKEVGIPKEEIKKVWGKVCKDIAELYLPDFDLIGSFWLPKDYLGEGIIEGGTTCFALHGENAHHKMFLRKHNRTRLFFLQRADNLRARARCIAFFPGNRRVIFTNFYYCGFPQNYRIFVDAFRYFFGLNGDKDISYGMGSISESALPIYINSDGVELNCHINGTKSNNSGKNHRWPCPDCGVTERAGRDSGVLCWDCRHGEGNGLYVCCAKCNRKLYLGDLDRISGGEKLEYLCSRCSSVGFDRCDCCDVGTRTVDLSEVRNWSYEPMRICRTCMDNCVRSCTGCDEAFLGNYTDTCTECANMAVIA